MKRFAYYMSVAGIALLTNINYKEHYWYMLVSYIAGGFMYMIYDTFIYENDKDVKTLRSG